MCSFFNPDIFCAEKCAICQKKTNIILRSSCHLCENYFCSHCSFSSPFLPKNRDAIFSSGKSCAVCALTWLIPALEESQMVKLPTKLLVAICKVYNIQLFVSSEKKELVAELKKQNPSLRGFPVNYKDNWPQVSIKIKDSKNILPQIENALKNVGRVSSSGSENIHGESSHFANEPRTQTRFQRYSSPRDNTDAADRTWPDASNSNSSEPPSSVPFNEEASYFNRSNFRDFDSRPRNMGSSPGSNGTSTGHPQPPAPHHEPNTESPPPGLNYKKGTKTQKKVYTLKQLLAEETPDDMVKGLPVSVLKNILRENFVNFDGVIEKFVLAQKVASLIASLKNEEMTKEAQTTSSTSLEDHKLNSNFEDEGLCKICFEEKANCVLLECGHSISCVDCGKELLRLNQPCPICRTDIVRVVRIFR